MRTYAQNFPTTRRAITSLAENVDVRALRKATGRVDILLASPECTNHTHARGAGVPNEASRRKAYEVIRYARALTPRWIVLENVVNMENWHGYKIFAAKLESLGYRTRLQKLNSADFGVPQARRRMFLICDRKSEPPVIPIPRRLRRVASDVVDLDGRYEWTPLIRKGRAKATLARAKRAIRIVGDKSPFLLVYYGTDKAGGWQSLDVPLRTVTTVDRFAVVRRKRGAHQMRMLQVEELMKAMGFNHSVDDRRYQLQHGTRRDKVRLLGNAVCPPVMAHIVRTLTNYHYR